MNGRQATEPETFFIGQHVWVDGMVRARVVIDYGPGNRNMQVRLTMPNGMSSMDTEWVERGRVSTRETKA